MLQRRETLSPCQQNLRVGIVELILLLGFAVLSSQLVVPCWLGRGVRVQEFARRIYLARLALRRLALHRRWSVCRVTFRAIWAEADRLNTVAGPSLWRCLVEIYTSKLLLHLPQLWFLLSILLRLSLNWRLLLGPLVCKYSLLPRLCQ
jgi:hypothetical protein